MVILSGFYVKDLHTGKKYPVPDSRSIIIGGEPPSADFMISADTISLIHVTARTASDGRIALDARDSKMGIWVINEAGEKRKVSDIEYFSDKVKFSIGEEGLYVFEIVPSAQLEQVGQSQESNADDVWIGGLKACAWLVFVGIVGIGISVGYPVYQWTRKLETFFVPVGISLVFAFLTVAFLMVFLNMASDLKEIRNHLTKK
jgi:hypothetical protein